MPVDDAKYHMKRCVDSGLWVPNAADLEAAAERSATKETTDEPTETDAKKPESDKEPVYTGVSTDDLD